MRKFLVGLGALFFLCIIVSIIGNLSGNNSGATAQPTQQSQAKAQPVNQIKPTIGIPTAAPLPPLSQRRP